MWQKPYLKVAFLKCIPEFGLGSEYLTTTPTSDGAENVPKNVPKT